MNGVGHGEPGDPMFTLQSTAVHGVCATLTKNYATHHGRTADFESTTMIPSHIGCLNSSSGHAVPGNSIQDTDKLLVQKMAVRRLTPKECERLQAFPDDYTAIAWNGKAVDECPDGPRYKALGNSMCVNVARWIGERIELINSLTK